MSEPLHIGFLIYPLLTQLDLTGPAQVLSRVPGAKIHLAWKNTKPVETDSGFSILPTTPFDSCPPLDVLCVPGGIGQRALMEDGTVLEFLRFQGERARYVTSVCTGSLLLGAAGLLRGYRAGCHWAFRDRLRAFGAEPIGERIVRDRNRISGGGVTAGIDFGLLLAAELAGEDVARSIQLFIEYDPRPPFDAGTPETAGAKITDMVLSSFEKETQ